MRSPIHRDGHTVATARKSDVELCPALGRANSIYTTVAFGTCRSCSWMLLEDEIQLRRLFAGFAGPHPRVEFSPRNGK